MSNVKELLEGKTFKFQIENGFKEALEDMSDSLNMLKEYVDSLSEEEIKCLNDKAREYCNEMEKRNKYNFKKRGNDKMDLFKYLNKNMMERYVKEGRGNIENRKLLKNDFDFLKIIEYNNKLIKERIHLEKNELVRKDIEEYVKQTDEYLKQRIDNLLETLTEPNAIDKYIERKNAIDEYILQVEKEFKRKLDIVNSISTKTDIKSELKSLFDKCKAMAEECEEETVQESKKYKEMQQEIERIHTYECAKAYFKLHEANDYVKEQVPITLQEGEILVFVDGYAFAVSFDDVEHYFAIGDDDILEYREDDEGKEYFKESECQQYAFENLMWNAIEFMENED